jgi:hypothetical protein
MPEEHTSKYQEHELEIERSMRSKRMNEDEHTEEEHMESTTKRMRAHKKLRSIILHTHKDHVKITSPGRDGFFRHSSKFSIFLPHHKSEWLSLYLSALIYRVA